MLAFIEHLADRAEGVPLLLVGTARPELFEHHPDYGARAAQHHHRSTSPRCPRTRPPGWSRRCWTTTVLPAELQQPILERAGGNPLYAEEFVRLLQDQDLIEPRTARAGSCGRAREVPFPDSVQALIAARLDTLPPDAKSLLADAAVVGKVFWAGAVAAMGEPRPGRGVEMLRELSRKELVRPARQSSMAGRGRVRVLARAGP